MYRTTLNEIMDFDSPIRVEADGTITETVPGVYAPELYMSVDEDGQILDSGEADYIAEAKRQGWQLLAGWTGQHGYRGPVMHASEYIGGALETHIRTTPGIYVVISVETDDDDENAAGWAIAYRER
jgi:hypothetical protein